MKSSLLDIIKQHFKARIFFISIIMVSCLSLLYSETLEELKARAKTVKKESISEIQKKMRARLRHSKTFHSTSNIGKNIKSKAYKKVYSEAKHNNASAQFALGSMFYQGMNVQKNYKKAMEEYEKAAKQGHHKAQFNLAYMYFTGKGVPRDHEMALHWFLKAGEAKDGKAELYLGLLYEERNEDSEAFYWYKKAAKEGYPKAYYELAKMYRTGRGCKKNLQKYIEYLKKAAMQSEAHAEFELGMVYLRGEGVEKSNSLAYHWLQKAYLDGNKKAKNVLQKFKKRIK